MMFGMPENKDESPVAQTLDEIISGLAKLAEQTRELWNQFRPRDRPDHQKIWTGRR